MQCTRKLLKMISNESKQLCKIPFKLKDKYQWMLSLTVCVTSRVSYLSYYNTTYSNWSSQYKYIIWGQNLYYLQAPLSLTESLTKKKNYIEFNFKGLIQNLLN